MKPEASTKTHTCRYFKGTYTYGGHEYRTKNGKEEKLVVCFGVCNGDREWGSLQKRCAECPKYAYSEHVDDWVREGDKGDDQDLEQEGGR